MLEKEHPDVQVLVRGNEITLGGDADAVANARRWSKSLLANDQGRS